MSVISCSNCDSLKEQCQNLKIEVAALNEKYNNLLDLFFRETVSQSTQTPPQTKNSLSEGGEHSVVLNEVPKPVGITYGGQSDGQSDP